MAQHKFYLNELPTGFTGPMIIVIRCHSENKKYVFFEKPSFADKKSKTPGDGASLDEQNVSFLVSFAKQLEFYFIWQPFCMFISTNYSIPSIIILNSNFNFKKHITI